MLSLLEMSFAGGLMIAFIVIVRAVAVNKLPKQVFLILWAIAGLRLALPLAIPSPASVYTAVGQLGVTVRRPGLLLSQTTPAETASPLPIWLIVWCAVAVVCALVFLVTHLRSRRDYAASLPVENAFVKSWLESHRLRRPVQVRYSDQITAPLTYGFLWPVILLPKDLDWSDEARLAFILAHEMAHVRRFDALWKWVLAAILCLHWFNPLVWVMYVLCSRDLELSCDGAVVKQYGKDARAAYALTLVGLEEKRAHFTPLASSFAKNALEERIIAIMKTKRVTIAGVAIALALVAVVITVFATSAAPAKTGGSPTPPPVTTPTITPSVSPSPVPSETDEPDEDWDGEYPAQYTQAQYDLVKNTLQLDGWEDMSIAQFNSKINAIFSNSENISTKKYEDTLHYAYEMVLMSLPDTDPLSPYLRNTVQASQEEYSTRLSEVYSGKQQDPEFSGEAKRNYEGDVYGDAFSRELINASYYFTYRILDQDKLTVKDRDQFLQNVMQGAQDYLDSKTMGELIDDNDGEEHFLTALKAAGAAASTSYIEFTGCEMGYYGNYGFG